MTPSQLVTLTVCSLILGCLDVPSAAPLDSPIDSATTVSATASWPADGASGVAPNLAFAAVGFDGALGHVPSDILLSGIDSTDTVAVTVERDDCSALGLPARECVRLLPERQLLPTTTYAIRIANDWTDGRNEPVNSWSASFTTSGTVDTTPPHPVDVECAFDEIALSVGCALIGDSTVSLRIATDEPALITWRTTDCRRTTIAAARAEATIALVELMSDHDQHIHFDFDDAAANRWSTNESVHTLRPLPAITVSEVRADPIGPEPQQEYVELFNAGDSATDLLGYSLSDDPFDEGDVIERSVVLHPGGRVLLVSDDFDADSTRDVRPAPGAMLIRIGTSVANGGLSNTGEPLFLRDQSGTRLSAVPSRPSAGSGVCLHRRDLHSRDGSHDAFVHDVKQPCTPGL